MIGKLKVRCISLPENHRIKVEVGKIYSLVTIGSCYALYDDLGNLAGTIQGRELFKAHFKFRKPRRRKRRKKKDGGGNS